MSKYISPWHLSLLCSIFALMHWQQLIAGITNVGDPRLVAKQPTACHQLVLQLSNWHSLPLSEMEQAALNRMAQSIAQLTLCQVTGEEIATATKLLEKACQKLRASLKFSRSLTLNSLTKMSCKSTRTHSSLMTDKAHVRGLWVALSAVSFCRFTLAPLSHHVSPFNVFLSDATRQHLAGFWIVSMNLWACCPCGLHSVISGLLAGGEPWFPHCVFVASWLTDCYMALCGLLFRFCFTLPYQSLRWYNVIISSCIFQLSMNWSADHQPCWFLFLCLFCVVCFLVFLSVLFGFGFWCLLLVLHGDSWMDYVSIQFSSLLYHIVIMNNVATALIRWICTMQLSFRLDKRPGESHLALDGKKIHGWQHVWLSYSWRTKSHLYSSKATVATK